MKLTDRRKEFGDSRLRLSSNSKPGENDPIGDSVPESADDGIGDPPAESPFFL